MSQDVDLARLRWRSRRGMLELDVLLDRFLQREFAALSSNERGQYEALLELPDLELLDMLYGRIEPPPDLAVLIERIQQT